MMNTILVPIDFSVESINALRTALDIAKQTNSQVIMLHNINDKENGTSDQCDTFKVIDGQTIDDSNEELLDCLEELRVLRMQYHVPRLKINFMASCHLNSKELYQLVKQKNIRMMLLGKKFNSGDSDFQLGNLYLEKNALECINLLVLAIDQYHSRLNYNKILLNVDSSYGEDKLFKLIKEFASILSMNVFVKQNLDNNAISSNRLIYNMEDSFENDNLHLISEIPEFSDELSELVNGMGIDLAASIDSDANSHVEIDRLPVHKIEYAKADQIPAFV